MRAEDIFHKLLNTAPSIHKIFFEQDQGGGIREGKINNNLSHINHLDFIFGHY